MKKLPLGEIVKALYLEGLSMTAIAQRYGVTQTAVVQKLNRSGVKRRTLSEAHQLAYKTGRHPNTSKRGILHPNYKDGKSSTLYRTVIAKTQCSQCGATEKLGIHHKNDDHYDNRIENLEVLCNPCHMSETKKAWWAAKKAGQPTPKSNGIVGWNRKP